MDVDLARLVVRHRHVAPMLSSLLGGTNAAVRISDDGGTVILERQGNGIGSERFPIVVEGETVGWVEGDHAARAVAAVLSYACAREADKRSLAQEALDRYRELNLVYDLAEHLSGLTSVAAIGQSALAEVDRITGRGVGFLLLADSGGRLATPDGVPVGTIAEAVVGEGIVGSIAAGGDAEIVNIPVGDTRAVGAERRLGSFLVAPLRSRGRTVGVIGARTDEPHEYQSGDLKVLTAIAALTGPAIDQARAREASAEPAAR